MPPWLGFCTTQWHEIKTWTADCWLNSCACVLWPTKDNKRSAHLRVAFIALLHLPTAIPSDERNKQKISFIVLNHCTGTNYRWYLPWKKLGGEEIEERWGREREVGGRERKWAKMPTITWRAMNFIVRMRFSCSILIFIASNAACALCTKTCAFPFFRIAQPFIAFTIDGKLFGELVKMLSALVQQFSYKVDAKIPYRDSWYRYSFIRLFDSWCAQVMSNHVHGS